MGKVVKRQLKKRYLLQNRRLRVQVLVPLPKLGIYEKTRKFPIFCYLKVQITDFKKLKKCF